MGQGAYGAVYLAEDMHPGSQSKVLSSDHLKSIGERAAPNEVLTMSGEQVTPIANSEQEMKAREEIDQGMLVDHPMEETEP